MRSKAGSFVVKILFVLLILSFGVWGIGDLFRSNNQDTTVATVGGVPIRADAVQNQLESEMARLRPMFGGSLDRATAKQLGLVNRVIDDLATRSTMDQESKRLDLEIGDQTIRDEIVGNPVFRGADGKFDRDTFNRLMAANNLTEAKYIALLRDDLPRGYLADLAQSNAQVPKVLVDALFRARNEKRVADWVLIRNDQMTDIAAPDDAAVKAYYDQHPERFSAPEYRGFTLVSVLPSDLDAGLAISDDKLKDEYQQRLDEFTKPERRHVEQMILPDEAAAKTAKAALDGGQDFAKVAADVAKQDEKTIDLGDVTKQELPPDVAEPAFTLDAGKVSEPVHTGFGWNLIKVTAVTPGGVDTFEAVKDQLLKDAKHEAAAEAISKLSNKLEDALAGGTDLASLAKQFSLKSFTVAAIDGTGHDPKNAVVPDFPISSDLVLRTVFETPAGQTSAIQETPDGGLYVTKTDTVAPPAPKPFETVAAVVKTAVVNDLRAAKSAERAKALVAEITPDKPLATVAVAAKLTVTTTAPFIKTAPTSEVPLPPGAVSKLFAGPVGTIGTATTPDGEYIAQLKEIKPADPTGDAVVTADIERQLTQAIGGDLAATYEQALRKRYPVKVNRAVVDQLF
ncbi:MAG TPA: peptidyl-prolyl cis-trans isomerase [Stellaceae bacterium]|nr:peptidyl-prolyl cis-trans isomerase [Stellaceae bacterium]